VHRSQGKSKARTPSLAGRYLVRFQPSLGQVGRLVWFRRLGCSCLCRHRAELARSTLWRYTRLTSPATSRRNQSTASTWGAARPSDDVRGVMRVLRHCDFRLVEPRMLLLHCRVRARQLAGPSPAAAD
jgi:hypothetical protein